LKGKEIKPFSNIVKIYYLEVYLKKNFCLARIFLRVFEAKRDERQTLREEETLEKS
jgi:hypothetical protein